MKPGGTLSDFGHKSTVRSGGMRRSGSVAAARSLADFLLYEVLDFAVLVFRQLEISRPSNHFLQLVLRHSSRPALLSQVEDPEGRRLRRAQRAVVATTAVLLDQLAHALFERIPAWVNRFRSDQPGSAAGQENHRGEGVRIQRTDLQSSARLLECAYPNPAEISNRPRSGDELLSAGFRPLAASGLRPGVDAPSV